MTIVRNCYIIVNMWFPNECRVYKSMTTHVDLGCQPNTHKIFCWEERYCLPMTRHFLWSDSFVVKCKCCNWNTLYSGSTTVFVFRVRVHPSKCRSIWRREHPVVVPWPCLQLVQTLFANICLHVPSCYFFDRTGNLFACHMSYIFRLEVNSRQCVLW